MHWYVWRKLILWMIQDTIQDSEWKMTKDVMDAIFHLLMYCHNSNVQLLQVTLKDISVIENFFVVVVGKSKCWWQQAFLRCKTNQNHSTKNKYNQLPYTNFWSLTKFCATLKIIRFSIDFLCMWFIITWIIMIFCKVHCKKKKSCVNLISTINLDV